MKPASPELEALLNSGQYQYADLYTITLKNGVVLRYTSADIDITHDGHLFRSGGDVSGYALIYGGRMRSVRGLEADSADITIVPGRNDLVNGAPMLTALRQGQFDRAYVVKERAFMSTWGDTSPGTLIIFTGELSEVKPSRTEGRGTAKSDVYLLNTQMPKMVYQASCSHILSDTGCGVNRAAYAVAGTALVGTSATSIACELTRPSGYFDLGTVRFTSGTNAGLIRTVRAYSPGSIALASPFPNVPEVGDAFTVTPGCGKTIPSLASGAGTFVIPASASIKINNLAANYGVTLVGPGTTVVLKQYELPDWGIFPQYDVFYSGQYNPSEWWSRISTGELLQYGGDYTVSTKQPDTAMTLVTSSPAHGQYALSNGTYTFSASDIGRSVTISYQYATSNAGAQCFAVYSNVSRFTGCPFVPVPETST